MKNQTAISKKDFYRKKNARNAANAWTALQLYAYYKAETVIKSEPRIPKNDRRRPAPPLKKHLFLLRFVKIVFTANSSSIVESVSNSLKTA
jgi:hypothetical protein